MKSESKVVLTQYMHTQNVRLPEEQTNKNSLYQKKYSLNRATEIP